MSLSSHTRINSPSAIICLEKEKASTKVHNRLSHRTNSNKFKLIPLSKKKIKVARALLPEISRKAFSQRAFEKTNDDIHANRLEEEPRMVRKTLKLLTKICLTNSRSIKKEFNMQTTCSITAQVQLLI